MYNTDMEYLRGNVFRCGVFPDPEGPELIEALWTGTNARVERIVSNGQSSPPGFWYDQEEDEWVVLLQGRAVLEYEGEGSVELRPGDWLLIPARCRHRVAFTSSDPCCVWLAVFAPAGPGGAISATMMENR